LSHPPPVVAPWLLLAMTTSAVVVGTLFSGFLFPLLFAAVVVVVAWPLYERLLAAVGGRRYAAAALTGTGLAAAGFGPLALLVSRAVQEATALARVGLASVQSGELSVWATRFQGTRGWMPSWLEGVLPADFDLQEAAAGPLRDAAVRGLDVLANAAPRLVGVTANLLVDTLLFLFAVFTFFVEGPRLLATLTTLSPLEPSQNRRLVEMFHEFANSVVAAAIATSVVQGSAAALGYWIAGVERVVFFGLLTAVCSFVPIVGTPVVWIPLAIATGFQHGFPWGLFLGAWGVGVASSTTWCDRCSCAGAPGPIRSYSCWP
jgi:predicted PurR-regulated permease PerM